MTDNGALSRLAVSGAVLGLAMAGMGARLAFLHLGPHEAVREQASERRRIEREIRVRRGSIYDRRGENNVLALDLPVKDICADPHAIVQSNMVLEVASGLADMLGLAVDEVAVRLNRPDRRFAYIRRYVHEEAAAVVRDRAFPGVFFRETNMRYYPQGQLMCHVLGFVNREWVGSAGVEQRMETYLRGSSGLVESRVNAFRQELYWQRGRCIPALAGGHVVLTLDQNVQYILERALDDAMSQNNAKGAWAIVQRVHTGEILAMASRPAFDLNEFGAAGEAALLNRAIGCVYEPGSTMKAVVVSAALNEGLVTPSTVIDCENGLWRQGNRPLRDSHPYGDLTVADVVKKSSNIGAGKLALMLGKTRQEEYLRRFGVGSRLGIDLPGEEAGLLASSDRWSAISPTRIAIGQGVAVTALQMLGVYCAIANNGLLMRPYVVDRIFRDDGTLLYQAEPKPLGRTITASTASTVRGLLRRVTESGGTGRRARVAGYGVAGKTGTAQKPVNGGYSDTAHMASFVGFLPADAPEIGIIVVVDEPQPLHTGGVVAGPVFGRIATETVRCLNIPPVDRRIAKAGQADSG